MKVITRQRNILATILQCHTLLPQPQQKAAALVTAVFLATSCVEVFILPFVSCCQLAAEFETPQGTVPPLHMLADSV